MPSQQEILRERTKQFAIRIVKMFRSLPRTEEARVLGRQVLRSGTSVAANYRAVCRSRSRADFISKLAVVTEEIDETVFWLELLVDTGIVPKAKMEKLLVEANELVRIFGSSVHTARTR
jgi:four helix bundle protein